MCPGDADHWCSSNPPKELGFSARAEPPPRSKVAVVSPPCAEPHVAHRVTDAVTVPDLVFSEMKFLRNIDGGKDHTMHAPDTKKKRKKDHARTKQEDISAFFTAARPALADTEAQAKSKRATNVPAGSKADRPRPMGDSSRAPETFIPTVDSEDKASSLCFSSRGPRLESTRYFSWSESIRAPTVTPVKPMDTSTDRGKRVDAWNRDTCQVRLGRSTTGRREMPSSVVVDRVTAISNRFRMSSVAPIPSGMSRSQSLPHSSSSPQRPILVNRAVNRHTYEDVTWSSSMPPVLQGYIHAGHQEDPATEGSGRASYIGEITESMRRRASTDALSHHSAHERPQRLVESAGALQHYKKASETASKRVPARKVHLRTDRTGAQHPARSLDTDRQSRRGLSRKIVEVPAVRFVAPDARSSRLPNFSGPSIYVQQERRQLCPVSPTFESDDGYIYPDGDGCGQGYIREAGILDHEDFEELPDEQIPFGLMEELDDDVEGLDYVADDVEQVQELRHTSVVTPGFWRPNRLY